MDDENVQCHRSSVVKVNTQETTRNRRWLLCAMMLLVPLERLEKTGDANMRWWLNKDRFGRLDTLVT